MKSAPDWSPTRFEGLWSYYPAAGRKDRPSAVREWDRLRPDDALIDQMALALKRQKASPAWLDGRGIPYLCRWLSHRRWEDPTDSDVPPDDDTSGWAPDPEVM